MTLEVYVKNEIVTGLKVRTIALVMRLSSTFEISSSKLEIELKKSYHAIRLPFKKLPPCNYHGLFITVDKAVILSSFQNQILSSTVCENVLKRSHSEDVFD